MTPKLDHPAPPVSLPADDGSQVTLGQFRGRPVVIYFYPKDDTPTCNKQACGLRDDFPAFRRSDAVVLGISPDSVASHARYRAKYRLPFTLLADTDHAVAKAYGVWAKKKLFGVSYMGIVRTTFVIDREGILRHIVPVTRVADHATKILRLVRSL